MNLLRNPISRLCCWLRLDPALRAASPYAATSLSPYVSTAAVLDASSGCSRRLLGTFSDRIN
jgi:hypothetical protein